MSEAANLVFQWIFSVKHQFFHVSIVKILIFYQFLTVLLIMTLLTLHSKTFTSLGFQRSAKYLWLFSINWYFRLKVGINLTPLKIWAFSPNFLVRKSWGICPKICKNCPFTENFLTRILGEIHSFHLPWAEVRCFLNLAELALIKPNVTLLITDWK